MPDLPPPCGRPCRDGVVTHGFIRCYGDVHGTRAGLKPMQPMRLHWTPRHGVWAGWLLSDTLCPDNCRKAYKLHC